MSRPHPLLRRPAAAVVLVAAATALSPVLTTAPSAADGGPRPAACPTEVTEATCWTGRDQNGAWYSVAVPDDWNGDLVMHSHGGPGLGEGSDPTRSGEDLDRWAVMIEEGFAWAGTAYRRGGYGARMAVADTENLRRIFVDEFGQPDRTYAHGQSWGGNVAAKLVEVHPDSYDGALLTNGILAGGSRGYDHRVDLRVVYQYYCGNHPRPSEPQYPLWMGLREGSTMTSAGLRARLQECTGYQSAPEERTRIQQRNLDDILAVTRVPERTLESHLRFATFTFRDIVHSRLDGRNPFTNRGVVYSGSHDDKALNRGVARFGANRSAKRDLMWDSDLTGATEVPTLTLHAIGDPTVFVEHESAYRATREAAGTDDRLVQVFTRESEHSVLSTSGYATAVQALDEWVETGRRPTPETVADACPTYDARYGTGCFVDTDFEPDSYATRVRPRAGSRHWPAMTPGQERAWARIDGIGIAP